MKTFLKVFKVPTISSTLAPQEALSYNHPIKDSRMPPTRTTRQMPPSPGSSLSLSLHGPGTMLALLPNTCWDRLPRGPALRSWPQGTREPGLAAQDGAARHVHVAVHRSTAGVTHLHTGLLTAGHGP